MPRRRARLLDLPGYNHRRILPLALVAFVFLTVSGCATRVWNQAIGPSDRTGSYDIHTRFPANEDEQFIVLAFSGGGTRSAAFAYGVLENLRDTTIVIRGQPHRLLHEVDVITAVSGGSFTAAYYGLFGDRIFTDFNTRFLLRDVQGDLYRQMRNPLNLLTLASDDFNRSARNYFNGLPTTLVLDPQAVDAVRSLAGRLLDASSEFTDFVKTLQ